ncbi:MAG: flagellar basal body P-ring protein FlgI [Phycisphaerales bacterium]|nr:flagellar basal body P-ring protein FlgI [Phycisphaerales bacterium]
MHRFFPLLLSLLCARAALAGGTTVAELARIESQGESVLWGVGLVLGLPGTGDSGKDLALARPLAEVLRNAGVPVADLDELKNAKTAAIVNVRCVIPESGARPNDTFDVTVSAQLNAKSLKGGTLFLVPLRAPVAGGAVYAIAEGQLTIDDPETPTVARVRGGARVMKAVNTSAGVGDTFNLILRPPFAGYAAASAISGTITGEIYGRTGPDIASLPPIATVVDDRTIRIDVPPAERANRAAFIADVLSVSIDPALLKLPAQVVINSQSGAIVVTGDVEISPVAITHKDLTITTTIPPPVATPANPLIETSRWARSGTDVSPAENARLTDLLAAFKQLNLPAADQITILQMLHRAGQLQARLVMDE